jgi:hypothetical protein
MLIQLQEMGAHDSALGRSHIYRLRNKHSSSCTLYDDDGTGLVAGLNLCFYGLAADQGRDLS